MRLVRIFRFVGGEYPLPRGLYPGTLATLVTEGPEYCIVEHEGKRFRVHSICVTDLDENELLDLGKPRELQRPGWMQYAEDVRPTLGRLKHLPAKLEARVAKTYSVARLTIGYRGTLQQWRYLLGIRTHLKVVISLDNKPSWYVFSAKFRGSNSDTLLYRGYEEACSKHGYTGSIGDWKILLKRMERSEIVD